jgi:hypothetical protein
MTLSPKSAVKEVFGRTVQATDKVYRPNLLNLRLNCRQVYFLPGPHRLIIPLQVY